MVSTLPEIPGHEIFKSLGIVRGVNVRRANLVDAVSRSREGLVQDACTNAYNVMVDEAVRMGANGIVGVSYQTIHSADGIQELLCYGTAVVLTRKST